ncbi:MAG: hypothetical protein Q9213_004025 [Squamulea squamosa]
MVLDTSSLDSSPRSHISSVPPVAGVKRPAPSLLPAFEPFASPTLPRPAKRIAYGSPSRWDGMHQKYPTPELLTSSTAIPSSSPPQNTSTRRPATLRTLSTFSERAPLSTVPTIELDEQGQTILMGRSSNSSHYQLSTNKLVSRVHIRAVYIPADPPEPRMIQVECMGWNGVRIHCEHKTFELGKGDTFTSETDDTDIMVDVQDARVILQWPRGKGKLATPTDSESAWEDLSPSRRHTGQQQSPLQSPLRHRVRLHSPVSPSRATQPVASNNSLMLSPELVGTGKIEVYEDEDARQETEAAPASQADATQATEIASQPLGILSVSQSSALSEAQEFSDNDEENDPIIHCFGPFGANLDSRMAAITAKDTPARRRPALSPLKASSISPQRPRRAGLLGSKDEETSPVMNHVINQLAYSRLASTPLSMILNHLPAHFKADIRSNSKENTGIAAGELKHLLESTACIGEVTREGKDAAGKPLESEFYYIPDMDNDGKRRDAVVEGLRKPGLRACRKQHKIYLTFETTSRFIHCEMASPNGSSNASASQADNPTTTFSTRDYATSIPLNQLTISPNKQPVSIPLHTAVPSSSTNARLLSPLLSLAPEIYLIIFERLDSIHTLCLFILTCQHLYDFWQQNALSICINRAKKGGDRGCELAILQVQTSNAKIPSWEIPIPSGSMREKGEPELYVKIAERVVQNNAIVVRAGEQLISQLHSEGISLPTIQRAKPSPVGKGFGRELARLSLRERKRFEDAYYKLWIGSISSCAEGEADTEREGEGWGRGEKGMRHEELDLRSVFLGKVMLRGGRRVKGRSG